MGDQSELFGSLLGRIKEIQNGPKEKDEKLREVCRLLRKSVPHYDWVGFYFNDECGKETVLGPFAGKSTEHVRIPLGRGMCGAAAQSKCTRISQDVSKETEYLSCSPKVKSEIVVPILKNEKLVGVLDIDSHVLSRFTEEDREFLENVCAVVSALF